MQFRAEGGGKTPVLDTLRQESMLSMEGVSCTWSVSAACKEASSVPYKVNVHASQGADPSSILVPNVLTDTAQCGRITSNLCRA